MKEQKPILRGIIHQQAFIVTIIISIIYVCLCILRGWKIGIAVYLLSQLILFGVSSTYHRTEWETENTRKFFQKLDHISIFLLISGTQTALSSIFIKNTSHIITALLTTWILTMLGIFRIFLMEKDLYPFNITFYIFHGLISFIPFVKYSYKFIKVYHLICFILGGIIYIFGGIVFGFQWPDPQPSIFGYHEIFHSCTVLGNICFMMSMVEGFFRKDIINN